MSDSHSWWVFRCRGLCTRWQVPWFHRCCRSKTWICCQAHFFLVSCIKPRVQWYSLAYLFSLTSRLAVVLFVSLMIHRESNILNLFRLSSFPLNTDFNPGVHCPHMILYIIFMLGASISSLSMYCLTLADSIDFLTSDFSSSEVRLLVLLLESKESLESNRSCVSIRTSLSFFSYLIV